MRRLDLPGLILAAALAMAPAAALADSRAHKYYYEDITEPFFALDPARPGVYRNQRPGSKDSSFAAVKPKDAFRVFVLGGSIASLLQAKGEAGEFAQALRAALPGRKVEVINCGMAGYESYREALIEQEILEHSPDLIVFLTGHNEGIASAPIPIWIMRAQERLSRLAAYRALVKTLRPGEESAVKGGEAAADARDAAFERNLTDNLRHARERGVPAAVVVPPRNYREPNEGRPTPYDAAFLPGWLSFLKGDYAGARSAWRASLEGEAESERKAFTWGFIARAEEKLGLLDEARASFDRAAAFDRAAICGTACQEILRRVARAEGAFLVEADAMFRALAHPRAPGLETFNDRMHWKPRFNCLMSSELIAAMRAQPGLGALPWDDARVRALKESCPRPGGPGAEDDDLRTLSYVLMGLSWPDFSGLSTVSVFYLDAIRRRRPEWFSDVPALMRKTRNPQTEVYGISMAPESQILPRFYWHVGEVRMLDKDFAGAVRDIGKALELDPSLSWARLSLAAAEGLRGSKARALAQLEESVARAKGGPRHDAILASAVAAGAALGLEDPERISASDPEHWIGKAEAAAAAGRPADALSALERARTLTPRPHQLRSIAQRYFILREHERFLEVFEPLAAAYPGDGDLWLSCAESALSTGRREKGLEALARAEALSPSPGQRRLIAGLRARFAK